MGDIGVYAKDKSTFQIIDTSGIRQILLHIIYQ